MIGIDPSAGLNLAGLTRDGHRLFGRICKTVATKGGALVAKPTGREGPVIGASEGRTGRWIGGGPG